MGAIIITYGGIMKKLHKLLVIAIIILLVIVGAFFLMGSSTPIGDGPSYNASVLAKWPFNRHE